jgi:hypothetical protein
MPRRGWALGSHWRHGPADVRRTESDVHLAQSSLGGPVRVNTRKRLGVPRYAPPRGQIEAAGRGPLVPREDRRQGRQTLVGRWWAGGVGGRAGGGTVEAKARPGQEAVGAGATSEETMNTLAAKAWIAGGVFVALTPEDLAEILRTLCPYQLRQSGSSSSITRGFRRDRS